MPDFEAPRREALPGRRYDSKYLKFQRIIVYLARTQVTGQCKGLQHSRNPSTGGLGFHILGFPPAGVILYRIARIKACNHAQNITNWRHNHAF